MPEVQNHNASSAEPEQVLVQEFTLGLSLIGVWTVSYSIMNRPDLAGNPGRIANALWSTPIPETEMLEVEFMAEVYGLDQPVDDPPIMHIKTLNHFHIPGMKEITEGDNVFIPKTLMVRIADAVHDTARGIILVRNAGSSMQNWVLPMLNEGFVPASEKWPEGSGERGLDAVRLSTSETPIPVEEKIRQERAKDREARSEQP